MKPKQLLLLLLTAGVVAVVFLHHQPPSDRTPVATGEASSAEKAALGVSQTPFVLGSDHDERTAPIRKDAPAFSLQGVEAFAEWLVSHKDALSARSLDAASVIEGVRLAEVRRPVMREWMRRDPRSALEGSLKWHEWLALPQDIQAEVEKPFSTRANYIVYSDCRRNGERDTYFQTRYVELDGERYPAFVYGRLRDIHSKNAIPLQGITLDGQAALWESPVQPLDALDLAAVATRFEEGNPAGQSWITGDPLAPGSPTALVGGELYHFANPDEIQVVAAAIAEAEALPGPDTVAAYAPPPGESLIFDREAFESGAVQASSTWTESDKTLLALRVIYQGMLESSHPYGGTTGRDEFQSGLNASAGSISAMSYGKTTLTNITIPNVLSLPEPFSTYVASGGHSLMRQHADAAAAAAGIDLASFDLVSYWTPPTSDAVSGFPSASGAFATLGGNESTFNGEALYAATHEFGHNYGLGHANGWLPATGGFVGHPSINTGSDQTPDDESAMEHDEYGDNFDIMGFPNDRELHFGMDYKAHLNWIEADEVWEVTSSGVYRVHRFDHPSSRTIPGNKLGLKVPANDALIWAGLRMNLPDHPSLPFGAYLVWANKPYRHRLIDTTPFSVPPDNASDVTGDREDAPLAVGKSWVDPSGVVRITNMGGGGSSPHEWIDLEVTFLSDPIRLYTDESRTVSGLTGSYVNRFMSLFPSPQPDPGLDWRVSQTVSGVRVDGESVLVTGFRDGNWGDQGPLGLTSQSDGRWEDYSVQWDGIIVVDKPVTLRADLLGGLGISRMWIDLNQDGVFSDTDGEFANNNWPLPSVSSNSNGFSAPIPSGAFAIRVQYTFASAGIPTAPKHSMFALRNSYPHTVFEVTTDASGNALGLVGSYINSDLSTYTPQDDWRLSQSVSGTRTDAYPGFAEEGKMLSGWGTRSAVGLTRGSDSNWNSYSVQWDGWIDVYQPIFIRATRGNSDACRLWVDLDQDDSFSTTYPEFIIGAGGSPPFDNGLLLPGRYRIRIQYATGSETSANQANYFMLRGEPAHSIFETWVDFVNGSPGGSGSFFSPFNTLAAGVAGVRAEGRIRIKAGTSTEPTLTLPAGKTYFIESFGGEARVGQ